MVAEALKAADLLAAEGIRATVVNMHTVKPLDEDAVLSVAEKCGAVVTAEEHSVIGGLGSAVAEVLAGRSGAKFARVGIEDRFGQSGTPAELFADYGLTAENIAENARPPGEVSAKKQVDFVSVYSAFSLDSYKKITVCHSFPQNP